MSASDPRHGGFFAQPVRPLQPLEPGAAAAALASVAEAADSVSPPLRAWLAKPSPERDFLAAAFDLSPFLRDAARRRPDMLWSLLSAPMDARFEELLRDIAAIGLAPEATEAVVMRDLRLLKNAAHVLIALSDLAGHADVALTVRRMSRLAEGCIGAAIGFLLREAESRGKLRLPDPQEPGRGSGLIVLGMGKLGGEELNFSSDIDLVLFFDPQAPGAPPPAEAAEFWARLARRLVRVLQDRTEHGYVFRTDLRLRPDPGSTPLAISVDAALSYYEGRGQNWERAAMIKARPVAGDMDAGWRCLAALRPFVWRRYLDYAAIADIHSIKRQIHAHKGFGALAVRGHDVKLGRGGIREIEFFVQTQQLIAGGRAPELRGRQTVPTLAVLRQRGWITAEAEGTLARAYWFLRRVEHAIQIIADEQSHVLPEDDDGLERIARLLCFADRQAFEDALRAVGERVEGHYAELFDTAPELSSISGNLVFTGTEDDPGTLETLARLGFARPSDIARIVRTWHFGRYPATRSAEARERLTELTPALLEAFGATRRADDALVGFDAFLAGLPAGIQLFSLLQSNRALLELLVTVLGAAPRLAGIITRRPHVFDGMLDPTLLSDLPDRGMLAARLDAALEGARHYEDLLDRLRVFAAEQKFLIGVRLLLGAITPARAGESFSLLAELVVEHALGVVREEFAARHGVVPGGAVAVLGMGRLGSRELTAGSDIDMILLYEHDEDAVQSGGEKPLAPAHYFARLTQRLVAALSAPTAEGVLYEIDLRLRPSGNKGPVATKLSAFGKYQRTAAWTWEHMALTRARPVAGDRSLCGQVEAEIDTVIEQPRERKKLFAAAAEMRDLLAAEKPPRDVWDLKLVPGGIVDLEFIAQCAVLAGAVPTEDRSTETAATLRLLPPSFAPEQARAELLEAQALYAGVTQMTRLCLPGPFDRAQAPPGLLDALLAVSGMPDIDVLEAHLAETQRRTRAWFDRLIHRDDGQGLRDEVPDPLPRKDG